MNKIGTKENPIILTFDNYQLIRKILIDAGYAYNKEVDERVKEKIRQGARDKVFAIDDRLFDYAYVDFTEYREGWIRGSYRDITMTH